MGKCNLAITAVSMAMHIAIGLKKQFIPLNNIFNKTNFTFMGEGKY